MKIVRSKRGMLFVFIYIILFLLFVSIFDKEKEIASFYLLLLTVPWSIIIYSALDMIINISTMSKGLDLWIFSIAAVLNMSLIYYMVLKYEKSFPKRIRVRDKTEFYLNIGDSEPADILSQGITGELLHSKFINKNRYYRIELDDGRKGYVKSEDAVILENNYQV